MSNLEMLARRLIWLTVLGALVVLGGWVMNKAQSKAVG